MLKKIDIKTEKRAQSKQEHVLAVLHNCTNTTCDSRIPRYEEKSDVN